MPLYPRWLARKEDIQERYNNREIRFSTITITVRNKAEADSLIAKGLYFGGYNHTVDRYWEVGPEEICPRCLEYGHTSYRGCNKPPKCYICTGNHEANEHKCQITGCSAIQGKACVYLPVKCIYCKGPHLATSNNCPKRREVIEEAKKRKLAAKSLEISRRKIQVVIPKPANLPTRLSTTEEPLTPSIQKQNTEMDLDNVSSQLEAQLQ